MLLRRHNALVQVVIGAIAIAIAVVSGCSDGDGDTVSVQGEELQLVVFEPASDVELVEYRSSAMGGVRFAVDPAHHLYTPGDTIVVSISDPADEAGWEVASVGLITQTADGAPIEAVDQLLDAIAATPSAEVTPTGSAIELFGHALAGYDIRADQSTRNVYHVSADRIGSPPFALFSYFPNGRIFLGETPAGVLVAASAEADEVASIDDIDVALGTLLNTIELTGVGLDEPLPAGQPLEPDEVRESTARGGLDPHGPAAIESPFEPIEPGEYQLANFGQTFTLEFVDDWHVQPNFPGFLVLTSPASGGPGDQDLVFVTGVVDVMPVGAGPVPAGEPVAVTTAEDVIETLSSELEVSDVETVDLGGKEATRFDVLIPTDATCTQAEPCEYAFRTSSGVVKQLSATHDHRIWWLEDGAEGPSMIIAMAPLEDGFIDRATDLLATLSFN